MHYNGFAFRVENTDLSNDIIEPTINYNGDLNNLWQK